LTLSKIPQIVMDNPHRYLVGVLLLGLAALYISIHYGRINSDLSTLVKPSLQPDWYVDNEEYKKSFPNLQQTAVVVISGSDAQKIDQVTRTLRDRLAETGDFESVFAPAVDEYLEDRKLYFLELDLLQKWAQGVEYNYGATLRLADSSGLINFIYTLADHLSANRGLPLPDPLHSLMESIAQDETAQIQLHALLVDASLETHYQLIVVKGRQILDHQLPNAVIVKNLNQVTDTMVLPGDTQIRLTGEVALAHEEISAGLSGIGIAGMVSLVLLAIILGFGLRSLKLILAIFALLILGVTLTMGFATLAIGSYNTLSFIFVVMFFGLGVDFAVHFTLRVKEALADNHLSSAVSIAMSDIGSALMLCMATSMIAFLSFVPTDYRGLGELGIISSGGMVIAFLLTITLLPVLFQSFKIESNAMPALKLGLDVDPKPVLLLFIFVAGAAGFVAKDLEFDYSVLAMRDANSEGMSTLLDLQRDKITTDYSISVIASDGEEAKNLKASLGSLDVVGDVTTPLDFVPGAQLDKQVELERLLQLYSSIEEILPSESSDGLEDALAYLGEQREFLRLEDQVLMQQFLDKIEQSSFDINTADQQMNLSLNRELRALRRKLSATPFDLSAVPERLKAVLISPSGGFLLTVQPAKELKTRQATEEFITEVRRIVPNIAGRAVVEWGVGGVVVEAFKQAVVTSLILISLMLIIYFRGIVLPVLVLVPIAMAVLLTLAICQLTGLTLNMANILVVPLIIGLGVDTGIHVVHRTLHAPDVTKVMHSSTARAVLISALTTIGTFFSLSFSPHKGAASVGLLLTIAISLLVVVTFLLLPALLKLFYRPAQQSVASG
jgi:hopanoid biosynthesis associated RND transporter like protein HpnN